MRMGATAYPRACRDKPADNGVLHIERNTPQAGARAPSSAMPSGVAIKHDHNP
jgi:hypothetical protein